jgi:hypothetical protein
VIHSHHSRGRRFCVNPGVSAVCPIGRGIPRKVWVSSMASQCAGVGAFHFWPLNAPVPWVCLFRRSRIRP